MKKYKRILVKLLIAIFLMTNVFAQYGTVFAVSDKAKRDKVEILVKYKDETKLANLHGQVAAKLGLNKLELKKNLKNNKIEVLEISDTDDINKTIEELQKDTNIEYAQPNYQLTASEETDPRFLEQWSLSNIGQEIELQTGIPGTDINAPKAWELTEGSPSVLIGVLDTGIDINHIDLKNNIYINSNEIAGNGIDDDGNGYIDDIKGWDFSNSDNTVFDSSTNDTHGTHVAGIIAAQTNTEGIKGTAPKARLLPLKFINAGIGYTSDAIEAINYAKSMGVKIINCSFGGPDENLALKDAMAQADILFACAAGNNGQDSTIYPTYPASYELPNVVSVAAMDNQGKLAAFSAFGSNVDAAAPGVNILSTTPGNTYQLMSGTSMAAPFASGIAALMKSYIPGMTADQMASRLKNNVKTSASLTGLVSSNGSLDAYAALTLTAQSTAEDTTKIDSSVTLPEDSDVVTALAVTVPTELLEQIHYGENGVNPATGNYSTSRTDMTIESPGFVINISRTYNSKDTRTTSTLGQGWTFGFEGSLKQDTENTTLWKATLPNGSVQVFVKNEDGTYTANDSRSKLVKQADDTHILTTMDQYSYKFDVNGWLVSMTDRNGNTITMAINAATAATIGRVNTITDQTGRVFTVTYNDANYITKITDPMGREINYTYDTSNRLIKVTDPIGSSENYEYDASNLLTTIKDNSGNTLETIIYSNGKVSTYTDILTNTFTYTYDTTNRVTTIEDSNNRITTKWYDASLYIIKSKDPDTDPNAKAVIIEYYLDANGANIYGEEKIITDRYGNITIYERDANGNITKITNPDLSTEEYQYDSKNNMIEEKDGADTWTFYIYDDNGINLLKKAQPLNGIDIYSDTADQSKFAITQYTYYTADESSKLGYLGKGLLKQEINPAGETSTYTYDKYGNTTTVTDAENNTTTNTYNILGWLTETISPKGYKTDWNYDNAGRVILKTLNSGEATRTVYDAEGRTIQEISPNQYDQTKDKLFNPALLAEYDDAYAGTRYEYYTSGASYGKLKKLTDPNGYCTSYTYDIYGNMLTEIKPNGSVYIYEYDTMNRVKKSSFKDNTAAAEIVLEEYTYPILTNGKHQKVATSYLNNTETAVTSYTYDYDDRLVEQQNPDGGKLTTTYNGNGTINTATDARGATTYYKYDGLNRLSETWSPVDIGKYSYTSITYDKANRKTQEMTGKDKVELHAIPAPDRFVTKYYTYYLNGKLKMESDSAGAKTIYQYDKDGFVSEVNEYTDIASSTITEYANNQSGQPAVKKQHIRLGDLVGNNLEDETDTTLITMYDYDKNGNLSKVTTPDGNKTTYTYDLMNQMTSQSQLGQDENGYPTIITSKTTYDEMGNVKTTTDAMGNITTYTYTPRELAKTTTKTTTTKNPVEGQPDIVTNYITVNDYDTAGRKTIEVSAKNYIEGAALDQMNRTEYTYDKMNKVTTKKEIFKMNPTDLTYTTIVSKAYAYDLNGNLIKELDGVGFEAGTGSTDAEKISTGYGTEYQYNLANQVSTILDPVSKERNLAFTTKYDYDGLGQKLSETNGNGVVTGYYYNDSGNTTAVTIRKTAGEPEQTIKENTYDLAGNILTQADGRGNITTYEYNALGKVSQITSPSDDSIPENIITHQYDVMGNLAKTEDTAGTINQYTYDKQGHQLSQTEKGSDGKQSITTSALYDRNGNKRFETDGNGNTKEYIYDQLNRLIETKETATNITGQSIIHSTKYEYDKNGNQTKQTDWRGNTYENIYDPINRLAEKKDPYNSVQQLIYNSNHVQIRSYDGNAIKNNTAPTTFVYDKNNRLIETTDPELHKTQQSYDNAGNISSKTDALGNTTRYEYDQFNRILSVLNASGETTTYTYDLNGNLLTQKDGKGNITTFEYNAINKPTKRIDHGGRKTLNGEYTYDNAKVESYTYDSDGNLLKKIDRNGVATEYIYDIHGKMLSQTVGGQTISYTYDNNGNQTSMTDSTGKTTRSYDELNRVIAKSVPQIGTSTYQYDIALGTAQGYAEDGYVGETSTDPKGNSFTKVYDKAGRLKIVKAAGETQGTIYNYDENGNRTLVTYENGAKEEYTYYKDNLNQTLTNKKPDGTIIDSYSYTYDAAHNQTSKTDPKGTTQYRYDKQNRLIYVLEPGTLGGKVTEYTYDKAGNRLTEKVTDGTTVTTTDYAYNEQNRLMTTTAASATGTKNVTTYTYDNNGNMLQKSTETTKLFDPNIKPSFGMFVVGQDDSGLSQLVKDISRSMMVCEYDVFNQLTSTKTGAQIAYYTYNGDGLRVKKNVNGLTTKYLYEYDKVVLELDEKGHQTAINVYGTNLISRTMDSQKLYYLYNGHADVTALIDAAGATAASYYYDAFGTPVTTTGTVNNPIRYAGYQYDNETGLYYLNARYYDSKTARFLSEDTYRGEANDPLSLNLYTYCHNEPVMYNDPTGHRSEMTEGYSGKYVPPVKPKTTPKTTPKPIVTQPKLTITPQKTLAVTSTLLPKITPIKPPAPTVNTGANTGKSSGGSSTTVKPPSNPPVAEKKSSDQVGNNSTKDKKKKDKKKNTSSKQGAGVTKLVDNTIQVGKNLIANPKDTILATGGVVLGTVGVIGSGIVEFISAGTGTPLAIPIATFSANTVVSSTADLINIATGNSDRIGSFNPLKSATKITFKGAGEVIETAINLNKTEKVEIGDGFEMVGGYAFEAADLYLGAKGVAKGVNIITDKSIIGTVTKTALKGNYIVPIPRVSNVEKAGAGIDVAYTISGWADKIYSKYNSQ